MANVHGLARIACRRTHLTRLVCGWCICVHLVQFANAQVSGPQRCRHPNHPEHRINAPRPGQTKLIKYGSFESLPGANALHISISVGQSLQFFQCAQPSVQRAKQWHSHDPISVSVYGHERTSGSPNESGKQSELWSFISCHRTNIDAHTWTRVRARAHALRPSHRKSISKFFNCSQTYVIILIE